METIGEILAIIGVLVFGSLIKRPSWKWYYSVLLVAVLSIIGAVALAAYNGTATLGDWRTIILWASTVYAVIWRYLPIEQTLGQIDLWEKLLALLHIGQSVPPAPPAGNIPAK